MARTSATAVSDEAKYNFQGALTGVYQVSGISLQQSGGQASRICVLCSSRLSLLCLCVAFVFLFVSFCILPFCFGDCV